MYTLRYCKICQNPIPPGGLEELCWHCQTSTAGLNTPTLKLPAGHAVTRPPEEKPSPGSSASPGQTDTAQVPQPQPVKFGGYLLLTEIARGGMGVVYKARQVDLDRTVALKMILTGQLASPTEIQRFKTEAAAAANLQHPNIVAIHEVGEVEGKHFFSMDYVEGQGLHQLLRQGPLPAPRAAAYLKTIAEAVHYAHQRGILHRDLKPSNVLIDATDTPRLTDFGLARRIEEESSVTLSGTAIGTPAYMAPEQALGRRMPLGPGCDIYSLGAILYEMLTGHPPFRATTPMETLLLAQRTEPLPPSKLNSAVALDLETICLKCLEKRPERRYFSAGELAEELGRFLGRKPIKARPVGPVRRAWHWSQQHPWIITGVLSFALLGLIGWAYGLRQKVQLLEWKMAHPGQTPEKSVYMVSSAIVAAGMIYLLLAVGMLPLADFRTRKLKGQPIEQRLLTFYVIFGLVQIALGIFVTMSWIEAYIWDAPHRWKWRQMGLLPAITLFWFGAIVVWIAAREYYQTLFGAAITEEPEPKQVLHIHKRRALLAFLGALAGLTLLALFGISYAYYWRASFWFFALSTMLIPFTAALWRASRGVLRPFWMFVTLNCLGFSFEFYSRLSGELRWLGLLSGLAAGAIMVIAAQIKPANGKE